MIDGVFLQAFSIFYLVFLMVLYFSKKRMKNDENNMLYDNNQINPTSDFTNSNLDSSPILECRNLFKTYGNSQALKGINLTIKRGRIVGLFGPNGSAKSTVIKLANGLLTPSNGEILIGGNKPGIETKKLFHICQNVLT